MPDKTTMHTTESTDRLIHRAAWVVIALAIVFSTFVRVRYRDMPLERDEGEYAYAGQLLRAGVPPYCLAYNMKLPGTYLAYAGIMTLLGETVSGIHLGLLAVNLATILLLYGLTRDLFDPLAGAVAAACYAILSAGPAALGAAAHATHFVALFGTAGAWALWRAMQSERVSLYFASGLLFGIAFLMKQQGVFLGCFGGLAVLLHLARRRPIAWRKSLSSCMLFAVGALLPFAATCLWLWQAGVFAKFWFWTVEYAQKYIQQVSPENALLSFRINGAGAIDGNWPIWLTALGGGIVLAIVDRRGGRRAFVLGFLGFSFLCVCPGFYFRNHYFITMLPSVAILAGVGVSEFLAAAARAPLGPSAVSESPANLGPRGRGRSAAKPRAAAAEPDAPWGHGLFVALASIVPAALFLLPLYWDWDYYFRWSPERACRKIYGANPFLEIPVIADYIRERTSPSDRVAVLGSEPQLYFLARRTSATGYIYTYPLMESHSYAEKMRREMIEEIEAAQPEFLVFVNVPTSWLWTQEVGRDFFKWIDSYVQANYRRVGLADIISNSPTEYKWGEELAGATPQSSCCVWVFRKNPQ